MSLELMTAAATESGYSKVCGISDEFLTFRLGKEEYGIDILKVQEIRGYEAITQIANAPDFIRGVVNLRGIIVPIILNAAGRVVGGVSDVNTLETEQLRPALGLGTIDDRMLILKDIEKMMSSSDMGLLEQGMN